MGCEFGIVWVSGGRWRFTVLVAFEIRGEGEAGERDEFVGE